MYMKQYQSFKGRDYKTTRKFELYVFGTNGMLVKVPGWSLAEVGLPRGNDVQLQFDEQSPRGETQMRSGM